MRLSQLGFHSPGDPEVTGVSEDSRQITPGMVFVAVPGLALDGHAFVGDAVARGAAAIVAERHSDGADGVPRIIVGSARDALAVLAARFYGRPAEELQLVGFTGTFGKTSASEILRALLAASGVRAGVLGSLGARYEGFHDPGDGLTTPAPVGLHRSLHGLRQAGAETVILEVTSHALRMGRVSGLTFAGGLIAAIMPGEHTDFHRSFEDYLDAKRLLLRYLDPAAVLAFDADNAAARGLAAESSVRGRAGVSVDGHDAGIRLADVVLDHAGAHFTVRGERLHSALLGRGHLRNTALALTYALASGVRIDQAREVLRGLVPLRRRMERYTVAGRTILDDTAAHPDSLRSTFDVAGLLSTGLKAIHPDSRTVAVYAVRGSRGADVNRRNARCLAELSGRIAALIVSAASDTAGPADRVMDDEADATRSELQAQGGRFQWHETLRGALDAAMRETRAGDLIVLTGAQGMNAGRELLN